MAKKLTALLAALLMICVCAGAMGEINLTRKDLGQAEGLDKSVTHIVFLLQDGDVTDTIMLASINSKTGRSVMTQVSCAREVEVAMGDGSAATMPLGEVYAQGGKKSRGFLVCRELNELLGLDISTYVAMDMTRVPELVDALGSINLDLTEREAGAMARPAGRNQLSGEEVLAFMRLRLEDDDPARSRSYDALMELLYQGLHSGELMSLISMGTKMLGSMDTNMGALMAVPLVTAVQGGEDRRELVITADAPATEEEVRALVHREIYE